MKTFTFISKVLFVLSAFVVAGLLSWWFVRAATEPMPGHVYERHVDCDLRYEVIARQGDLITFTNLRTKETKTITRDQWFRHEQ